MNFSYLEAFPKFKNYMNIVRKQKNLLLLNPILVQLLLEKRWNLLLSSSILQRFHTPIVDSRFLK